MNHFPYRITQVVTPATSLALVTLDQAKGTLGIDIADTSHDAALQAQIDAVSMAINNYCDRIFAVQAYRDQLRNLCGDVGQPLVTRQYPIVVDDTTGPLVTVTENGSAIDAALIEVYPETGEVYRLDAASLAPSAWSEPLTVVAYTAGYETIPADIQAAALDWLTLRWAAQGRDPALRSETIPDLITQVYAGDSGAGSSGGAIPAGAENILAAYRMWTV